MLGLALVAEVLDAAVHLVHGLGEVDASLAAGARWLVLDDPLGSDEELLDASRRALAHGAALIVAGAGAEVVARLPVAHRPLYATDLAEVLAALRMGPPGTSPVDRAQRPLWSLMAPTL
jgi:hypothetical protein